MSQSSSPTSSQLDDVDLAQPHSKQYEHHTDVGFMFGEQQWRSLRREAPSAASSLIKADERSGFSGSPVQDRILAEPTGRARPTDGAAVREEAAAAMPALLRREPAFPAQRMSEARSDASEEACTRVADGAAHSVTVDVLSPAFTLTEHAWHQAQQLGKGPADVISQRACTGLGVEPATLRYFELREVAPHQLRAHGRYAVAIDRSGFTLQDMEDALSDKARWQESAQKSATALEAMQDLVRDFDADRSKLYLQTAELKEEIRRLEQRCAEAELQSSMLTHRLARSDQMRMDQLRAIEQLRQEVVDIQTRHPARARAPSNAPLTSRKSSGHGQAHAREACGSRAPPARGKATPETTPRRHTYARTARPGSRAALDQNASIPLLKTDAVKAG